MVSLKKETQHAVRCILDAVNSAMRDLGREALEKPEEVQAVIFIAIKEKTISGLIYGGTSKAKVLNAMLTALVKAKIISLAFGKAVLDAWMLEQDARKE